MEQPDGPISLGHLTTVLRRYRPAIQMSLIGIFVFYVIVAIMLYLFGATQHVTNLPFRVVFEGADGGHYPNGLDYNSTEITATQILQKVYTENNLQNFVDFSQLKSSVFVIERNKDLERLQREYEVKLADPKTSPIDRERIEKEYDMKKASIRRTDYALSMVFENGTKTIPVPIRVQVLSSILNTWADQAMNEKGAGRYRLPVLSRNILGPDSLQEGQDYLIAIDILRTKVNRIILTIDQLLQIRGAEVLTTGKERITLPEIRANLEDTRRFRLEPLMATIRQHHLSRNFPVAMEFLQSQLESARRHRDQEQARIDILRRSLELYTQRDVGPMTDTKSAAAGTLGAGQQVIPQVDKSFLDQLSDLISQKRDIDYRQKLVNDLNGFAINQLLPAQTEEAYYEALVQSMRSAAGTSPSSPALEQGIQAEYQKALDETYKGADQVTAIYGLLSKNLNPGLTVYTLTDPVEQMTVRAFSVGRLLMYGILLMVVAVPLVLFAALLHNRIREEEEVEESLHRFPEAGAEPAATTRTSPNVT